MENESKAAKLKSPAKGTKNFVSLTISASSKIAQSRNKKILVERNDPLEEDEESETEPDEKEFQMDANLDDGREVEIEGVDVLEIEEAFAIQLA
ncbi:hypothetical protein CQW23_31727 [Capsicum baccatum]|uniref:Uncharacterized protein n=1 Tax=Capsicum baccatum TaxID=33114 RepID=A0A2G2V6P7_CAPBA|nr:hypothetical protein CQW23_31727 [Capsicum baccatum]